MSDEAGVEVVLDDASPADHSVSSIERRPPWFVAAIVVSAVGALIVVSLATRSGSSDDDVADSQTPASTSIAPPTTTTTIAENTDRVSTTVEPRSAPTFDTATVPDPAGSASGTSVQLLPPDVDVLAAIPAEGIDAWLFTVSPQNSLTRTDLITGEQQRVFLDTSDDFITEQFNNGINRLVQIGDRVAIAIQSDVFIIDMETLFVSRIELDIGDRPTIIAYDSDTLWLQTASLLDRRTVISMTSLDINSFELGDELLVDPVGIGFGVAGAANGVLRYHVPFVGSWEVTGDSSKRLPDPILAGGGGGTVELRCSQGPGDCQTVIYDIAAQTDAPIDLGGQVFGMTVSPDLQWVATADGHLINVDGTVINLPSIGIGQIDGVGWTWSNTSRFLTDSNYRVFDITGQIEIFELPRPNGFGLLIGSVLFERSVGETAQPTANA